MADPGDPTDPAGPADPPPSPPLEPPAATGRAPLDAAGNERPTFVLDLPEDPALEPLIAAFEAGNYARVRELSGEVARTATDPAVRAAALEFRHRIDPDPVSRAVLLVSVGLFVFLAVWAYAVQTR